MNLAAWAERGLLPDILIRAGIRRLLNKRLRTTQELGVTTERLADQLRQSPLAIETDKANEQHYEVPASFFQQMLGPRLNYSSCLYPSPSTSLQEAEELMLELTCERARLEDGQRVLELGCGWGSLTLWMAEKYPHNQITAVSNSASQREFILARAESRSLTNIEVITANVCHLELSTKFDRVVSVEMFEHMRNYELLFSRIAQWLDDGGKAFAHIFCHRELSYLFETEGPDDWMGREFFSGGTMPSYDLFSHFRSELRISSQWLVNGQNYWRTCEDWLARLDGNRKQMLEALQQSGAGRAAKQTLQRWRIFLMACAELFRFREGTEWHVAHYLFEKTNHSGGGEEPSGNISTLASEARL